ncbi:class II fructose-bisphosphate aldolase [Rhodococcus opacus]|uniref:Putative aldolase n=1 Tax=Rhodococcus opacus (strain B4) TaxID=632772 RepID=C1B6A6_RHOOB|nr:class II fructose-bisphosphate aldolase [Rhodococcus opacus]BAH51209.1 putative aldolase [Rhodococcus opacus B4]
MPRAPLTDLVTHASRNGESVGAFTCYNLEQVTGVMLAAESARQSVCLLLAEGALRRDSGPLLARLLVAAADDASVPVAVQFDHTQDLEMMARALDLGVTAIMADGSALPYTANVDLVVRARALAQPCGASIEAELAHVPGDEDSAGAVDVHAVTDVVQAVQFVRDTGTDLLAVAIGNVHGTYASPPDLDMGLLSKLHAAVPVPLTLHGTSGVPDDQVRRAIAHGIRKVNVNTELRQAYLRAARDITPDEVRGWNLLTPADRLIEATRAVTDTHLRRCLPQPAAAAI